MNSALNFIVPDKIHQIDALFMFLSLLKQDNNDMFFMYLGKLILH